uniref:Uncharacterized protein n=1 Tax=Rousettus aegyptiacus TaxID=9407 RepID=A0A7J8JIK5_ROUAE|nr:hypothetical protein HJG63_010373 [Rousettus aegyptiacus]
MVIHRGDMLSEEPPGIRICMRQPGHQRNAPAPVEDQLSWAGPSSFSCVHYGKPHGLSEPWSPYSLPSPAV